MADSVSTPVPGSAPVVAAPVAAAPAAPVAPVKGSPEYNAQMAALAPANVPDKFKNADGSVNMAALVEGYKALEVKQSQGVTAPEVAAPTTEKAPSLDDAFKAPVVAPATDVWKAANAELDADGKISDATRESLRKAHNATDDMIDGMIAGRVAQRESIGRRLADAAGGAEQMSAAIQHARKSMSEPQLAALRSALEGPTGELVMRGLVAQMGGTQAVAKPAEPRSVVDTVIAAPVNASQPFSTNQEMLAAFRDPRYNVDPQYTEYAARRMAATQGQKR